MRAILLVFMICMLPLAPIIAQDKAFISFETNNFFPLPDSCINCNIDTALNEMLSSAQIDEILAAIKHADSLSKKDFPCYEYWFSLNCDCFYDKWISTIFEEKGIFILEKEDFQCVNYAIKVNKRRTSKIMEKENIGTVYCEDDITGTRR